MSSQSSKFILEVLGAPFKKLCIVSVSSLLLTILFVHLSNFFLKPSVSMRLRPKRTGCRVECFGGFEIQKFSNLFLFFRGDLT
ncbi:unnamed protein product [Lathyrus sativus]|nr:unnamed protein product [Lathyrus sativus]